VGDAGCSAADNRLFLHAVLWIARSGPPWRDLPERFGPWNSAYRRFRRWAQKGVWQRVFEAVQEPDLDWAMLDSTSVPVGADKAYDTNAVVASICHAGAAAVIPSKRTRLGARPLDRNLYADRNKVEHFFNRLEHFRRLATRYEKTATSFLAFAHCVATLLWLL
jgi:transposase